MKRAFTLIELLVVIGIIAILAAAAMTALPKAFSSAEQAKCSEAVSQVATALTALFDEKGVWPKALRENGATDGKLDGTVAYPLAKSGRYSLQYDEDSKQLKGSDKLGVLTPWASDVVRKKGSEASLSTRVPSGGTIDDHILHYAIDLDGDGRILGASVGGESVDVRATAIVWCGGKDGKIKPYSKGLKSDDVYSWDVGKTRKVR